MPTNDKWYGSKWITKERRLAIYLRDEFTCAYCGANLHNAKPKGISLDHLICRSQGGSNESTNLVTVCAPCNSRRGDTAWSKYATGGARLRIRRQIKRKVNLTLAKAILRGEAADPRGEAVR